MNHTPTPLKEGGTTQIINQEQEETVTEIVTTDFGMGLTIGYIYPEYAISIIRAVNAHNGLIEEIERLKAENMQLENELMEAREQL